MAKRKRRCSPVVTALYGSSARAGLAKRPEDRPKCCAAVLAGGDGFNAEKQRCGGAEGEEAKFDRTEHIGCVEKEVTAKKDLFAWILTIIVLLFLMFSFFRSQKGLEYWWDKFRAHIQDNSSILTVY